MKTIPYCRTFAETLYYTIQGSYHAFELTVDVHGSLDPPDDTVGYRPLPEIDGLTVTAIMRLIDGTYFPPHLVDWIDSEFNRAYWYGEIREGELEEAIIELMES